MGLRGNPCNELYDDRGKESVLSEYHSWWSVRGTFFSFFVLDDWFVQRDIFIVFYEMVV